MSAVEFVGSRVVGSGLGNDMAVTVGLGDMAVTVDDRCAKCGRSTIARLGGTAGGYCDSCAADNDRRFERELRQDGRA